MKKIRKHDIVTLENSQQAKVVGEARISGIRILEVEIIEDKQIEYVQDLKLKLKKQWLWNLLLDKLK